jgi:diguanylate cyclase (GGDEF)-like protein
MSILMVDIDWFKRVNDTYGHTAGDQVLLTVAKTCRQALRATDIVGRWGGEEYVIILPEADMEGAALIAERIRRMVSETEIPLADEPINVTVSIGVAEFDHQNQSLETLIDCADRAMYASKQAGRNQVRMLRG